MPKDYYNILGVDRSAKKEEIKKAFRQKAHQYHPDKQGGDEAKFKEINEAYQVLGNEEKRQQYDQFGTTFNGAGPGAGGFNWSDFANASRGNPFGSGGAYSNVNINFDDLGDIFGDVFGFSGRRSSSRTRARQGSDLEMNIEIDFHTSVFGGKQEVEIYKTVKCGSCHGSGNDPNSKISTCQHCQGKGKVERVQQTILGAIKSVSTCQHCQGQGQTAEKKCGVCGGEGIVKENKRIRVDVPAGISDGETIRISGMGEAGQFNGPDGDLYLVVKVENHTEFERKGDDILSTVRLSYEQAALGDKIQVNTVEGKIKLKIPAGTQPGTIFRLKGKGVPHLKRFGRGDHLVETTIRIPKNLSHKQKKLIKELGL